MKKVFLIRGIAPESYGGAEAYQLKLAEVLRDNGYVPVILTSSDKLLELSKKNDIKAIRAPYFKRQNWSGWRNLLLPEYWIKQAYLKRWYKKQIKKYQPIALDVQSRDEWIAATLAGKKAGVKIFWTDHADFRSWVLQNVDKKGKNLIGKRIIKLMDIPAKIIMISEFEANWLKKNVSSRKLKNLTVIKNGAIDRFSDYYEIRPKRANFCYVGRIVEEKGIKDLLNAFNVVYKKFNKATLDLYGDGPDFEKYKKLAECNSNITFYGNTDEPLAAMAGAEVFVLPSYKEGLSLSLLEAAMMGKTIIATNVDGNPEIVLDKKTGLLVPVHHSELLAEAMIEVVKNKEISNDLAKNARVYYKENFDFEKNIKESFIPLLES